MVSAMALTGFGGETGSARRHTGKGHLIMKTKKSDEFVKQAQKLPRAKFAVVGKGSSWTLFTGSDLAKATPENGETLIQASYQKKPTTLSVMVVGGGPEVAILKTKVFADQLQRDAKSVTFKPVSPADNAELEKLQADLDITLGEQISKLPVAAREAVVPLFNQAKKLAADGELGPARAKVAELKSRMGTNGAAPKGPVSPAPPTTPTAPSGPAVGQHRAAPPAKNAAVSTKALEMDILQTGQSLLATAPDSSLTVSPHWFAANPCFSRPAPPMSEKPGATSLTVFRLIPRFFR